MTIARNSVVSIAYTLKNASGEILDSSQGRDPLVYLHGTGALIPGLESQLNGKKIGDKFKAVIKPEDAYGTRREELVMVVSKDGFQGTEEIFVGMQVQLDSEHGPRIALISKIDGTQVTLDLNHPLADVTLHFDVEVADVRVATADEIAHGHVHGHGGHHH